MIFRIKSFTNKILRDDNRVKISTQRNKRHSFISEISFNHSWQNKTQQDQLVSGNYAKYYRQQNHIRLRPSQYSHQFFYILFLILQLDFPNSCRVSEGMLNSFPHMFHKNLFFFSILFCLSITFLSPLSKTSIFQFLRIISLFSPYYLSLIPWIIFPTDFPVSVYLIPYSFIPSNLIVRLSFQASS